MRPRAYGRSADLMQIAAAVVGSGAAAQVIVPAGQDAERERPVDLDAQADQNTYLTGGTPGVSQTPHRMDVVGANQRRLIAFRAPEGVWIGGCLVSSTEDLERLCAWLRGRAGGES